MVRSLFLVGTASVIDHAYVLRVDDERADDFGISADTQWQARLGAQENFNITLQAEKNRNRNPNRDRCLIRTDRVAH